MTWLKTILDLLFGKKIDTKKNLWKKSPFMVEIIPKSKFEITAQMQEFAKCLVIPRELAFSDWAIFTHAWHETGGFKKVIGSHNYWGIKRPKKWNGNVIEIKTHEYIKVAGKQKKIFTKAEFIDFATCEQALTWYCSFIEKLYPEAYNHRFSAILYFKGLISGKLKYATDPDYFNKLVKLEKILKEDKGIIYLITGKFL